MAQGRIADDGTPALRNAAARQLFAVTVRGTTFGILPWTRSASRRQGDGCAVVASPAAARRRPAVVPSGASRRIFLPVIGHER
jgi:hypothetical protein